MGRVMKYKSRVGAGNLCLGVVVPLLSRAYVMQFVGLNDSEYIALQ